MGWGGLTDGRFFPAMGAELGTAHAVIFKKAGAVLAMGGGNHILSFFGSGAMVLSICGFWPVRITSSK